MNDNEELINPKQSPDLSQNSDNWERGVLNKLIFSTLQEQKRSRRWGIFFKTLIFIYLFALLIISTGTFSGDPLSSSDSHSAVINIVGPIIDGAEADAEIIIKGLRAAKEHDGTKGIILKMNTPGGTPVQASYVYDEIQQIKKDKPDLPIYAVVSEICASGGYYVAAAADKIFVNRSSIVGSIGVIMNGFGFVDTMKKFGIERRLLIAGEHKAIMDAFSPTNQEETKHVQSMLNEIHEQFMRAVRDGRGDKLADDPAIYSGLVWTGEKSIELGLADDFGTIDSVATNIIGESFIVDFTPEEKLLDRLTGKLGASFEKVLWQLFAKLSSSIE